MSRFGILSILTRPARTWCRHASARLHRQFFDFWIRNRISKKLNLGRPVRAIFVIHEPRSYGALTSIIDEMGKDPRFEVIILAVHYRHGVFSDNNYHDGGAANYFRNYKIPFKIGSDSSGNFIDLKTLSPDVVFFQTPYNQFLFPPSYSPKIVSQFAFLAYMPYYGISLSDDEKPLTHTPSFFQYVRYAFMGSDLDCVDLRQRVVWSNGFLKVFNSGCPKFAYVLSKKYDQTKSTWRTSGSTSFRFLWTPRWNPDEGNSHFLTYWQVLLNWAREKNNAIEFVLRPHPLMFNYLLKTRKLTESQLAHIKDEFALPDYTHIDESDEYQYTFLGADCLIADPNTSMALEFFVQDKPVVYTDSEKNNDCQFMKGLLPGYYVVHTEAEMIRQLNSLLSGEGDSAIKDYRKKAVERLMAPLKEMSCVKRAINAIVSDVISK